MSPPPPVDHPWSHRVLGVPVWLLGAVQGAAFGIYWLDVPVVSHVAGIIGATVSVALLPFLKRWLYSREFKDINRK